MTEELHTFSPPFTWATVRGEFQAIQLAGPEYQRFRVAFRKPGEQRYRHLGTVDGDYAEFDAWRIRATGYVPLPDGLSWRHGGYGSVQVWDVVVKGWLIAASELEDGAGYLLLCTPDGEKTVGAEVSSRDLAMHHASTFAHIVQIGGCDVLSL